MTDLDRVIAAAREALAEYDAYGMPIDAGTIRDLLAALDAQPKAGEVWQYRANSTSRGKEWIDCRDQQRAREMEALGFEIRCLYAAPPAPPAPPAAAVSAANVTPMRQPRADLARLVESINAAVYANGDGLSVTEAIGALELAKLELLKEQEQ